MSVFDFLTRLDPAQLALGVLILALPGVLLGVLVGAALNRAAYGVIRVVARLFRILFWPVRAFWRLFGIKMIAKSRPARIALMGTGSAVRGQPGHLTEIEWALQQPDNEAGAESAVYDFHEERKLLRNQGRIFKWFRIPGDYIPDTLTDPFTDAIADRYAAEAKRFFGGRVDLDVNPNALYEDAEGGVIISLFRGSDRRCFYALDQLRRVINHNALQLIIWLGLSLVGAMAFMRYALDAEPPLRWILVSGGAVIAVAAAFFFQLLYANQQRQNMREFSDFLTRYLGLISNRFREASATASRVIQGDERDSKVLAANAQKWQKIMIWLSFRPFFIESFVRSVNFQIRRNFGYYELGGFLALIAVAAGAFFAAGYGAETAATQIAVLAASSLFVALSSLLIHRRVASEELNQMNWLGYDNLDVGKQMDEVIGKYAEYIGLWISRFDR